MHQLLLAATAIASAAPAAASPGGQRISVELIASSTTPRPGSTMLVGFRMSPQPGWHGYWSNPGGSGIAPTVHWAGPRGVHFGPLLHPAPTLLQSMGLVSYVHAGPHVLISRVRLDGAIKEGTVLPITADLNWAACSKNLCVPQHASFSLQMVAGKGAPSSDADLLNRALAEVPRTVQPGTYTVSDRKLFLQLPTGVRLDASAVRFFPDENGFFDSTRARAEHGRPIRLISPLEGETPHTITGVLSDGSTAYRVSFRRGSAATTAAVVAPAGRATEARTANLPELRGSPAPTRVPTSNEKPRGLSQSSLLTPVLLLLGLGALLTFASVHVWRQGRS